MLNVTTITITPEILNLVAELDEFKGTWRALGTLAPDRLDRLRHVATIESVGSSTRIEGSSLSDRDVERLLGNLETGSLADRDEQEVAGYAHVMELVFASWREMSLAVSTVRQLHRELLRFSETDDWHRGNFKTSPISVAAFDDAGQQVGIVFDTPSPFDTPRLMEELVDWFNAEEESGKLHPLLRIAVFVVTFLEIHPFQNGNGRLSRVLTTLLLLRGGYEWVQFSSLERVIEQSKDRYYLALRLTQRTIRTATPDWQPWLEFFLRALQQQAARLRIKVDRERLLGSALPDLASQILSHAEAHGRVTMNDMLMVTGASRNTLKEHFRILVRGGHLVLQGKGRGSWYTLP